MFQKKIKYLFCLSIFCVDIAAQVTENFQTITSKNGNSQSIIYSIAQDTFGNVWAATEEGVVRYNSQEAFLYNKYNGIKAATRNRTFKIFIDSQQRIWIGSEEGFFQYDKKEDVFVPHRVEGSAGPTLIKAIVEDGDGHIWIGGFNGVWRFEPSTRKFQQFAKDLSVLTLHADGGELMVGSEKGLFLLNTENGNVRPADFNVSAGAFAVTSIYKNGQRCLVGTRGNGLFKTNLELGDPVPVELPLPGQREFPINKILADAKGNFYLATDGAGLLYLDHDGRLLKDFTNDVNRPNSISSDGIYDVILGEENILWIATYGGGINWLNLSDNVFQNIAHQLNEPNSLGHNFTRSILEDSEGNVWFGTKEGISVWYRNTDTWRHLRNLGGGGGAPDIVMALAENGGHIWAGTYGRGAFKIDKKNYTATQFHDQAPTDRQIDLSRIYAVLVDSRGNTWLGGIERGLYRISPQGDVRSFSLSQIRHLIESRDGSILAAGRTGVQRIQNGNITKMEALNPSQPGVDFSTISCLYEMENGDLVLGTNGSGLVFFNIKNKNISSLDPTDGLPSDIVQGVLRQDDGTFWLSTTRGLASVKISENDTLINVFDQGDGLASSEFNYGSFAKLSDGHFAFGGVNGVTFFQPENIGTQGQVPRVVLEDFQLLNQKQNGRSSSLPGNVNTAEEICLKYFENALGIHFAGVLHSNPSKVRYRWKMEGLNDVWSAPTTEDNINFTNLSPGKYTFKVQAANRDGVWGDERQFRIEIAPPWWATKLAYFIYFLLAAALAYAIFYVTRMLIRKRNADEQIAFFSNITHELKTPLTILLSSLDNASQSGSSDGTNQKVKATVERLNKLFDQLLHFNKSTTADRQRMEVSKIQLRPYVERVIDSFRPLLKERDIAIEVKDEWGKDIFYFDKEALDKILFNLISNAIKYSEGGGEIEVKLFNGIKDGLRLSVSDNGIGIPKDQQKFILKRYYRGRNAINSQTPGTGLGLMIVKNLVERNEGSISFDSEENVGTTFTVVLKSQRENYHESAVAAEPQMKVADDVRENTKLAEYSDAKIMVVEDNDELRQLISDHIGTYFQVFEAKNGKEGMELMKQTFPDLILTDYIMPDMDGMELVQALQSDINTSHIPIFMMTVLNSSEHKIESIESGVAAYLEKPLDFDFLLAKITSTLDRQKKMRERYVHESDVEEAADFRSQRDTEFLNDLEKFVLEKVKEESLSVHDLCRHVGMSRTALYMKLKNMVDLSPQNFIIHTRLRFAKKLLREEGLNVKEVAYLAGFSNPKYFSTSFKKMFGVSPTGYLKSLKEG